MGARTIHPFPARMAPEIAVDYLRKREDGSSLQILDPMCGSGTVLSAAVTRGHAAIGIDVDPLAVLMATVATSSSDFGGLEQAAEEAAAKARQLDGATPPWHDPETTRFVEFWFGLDQRLSLGPRSLALRSVESTVLREALQLALSRIIITKVPKASLAGDTSHSRPHRVATSSSFDVIVGFLDSVKEMKRILDRRVLKGSAQARLGDSRTLLGIADESIDLSITSPPYLNAIDYMRGHKMSLVWLGYKVSELRSIRSSSIGAERSLDGPRDPRAEQIVEFIQGRVANPDLLPLATLARYANDVVQFGDQLWRVTKPRGKVVTVVGNSSLRGNFIANDRIVQSALEGKGFSVVERFERELPENRRYLPMSPSEGASSLSKRMRTETVLVVEKKN